MRMQKVKNFYINVTKVAYYQLIDVFCGTHITTICKVVCHIFKF